MCRIIILLKIDTTIMLTSIASGLESRTVCNTAWETSLKDIPYFLDLPKYNFQVISCISSPPAYHAEMLF